MENFTVALIYLIIVSLLYSKTQSLLLTVKNEEDKNICLGDTSSKLLGIYDNLSYYICNNGIHYTIWKENKTTDEYLIVFESLIEFKYTFRMNDSLFIIYYNEKDLYKIDLYSRLIKINWNEEKLTCDSYEERLYCLILKDNKILLGTYDSINKQISTISLSDKLYYFPLLEFTMKVINKSTLLVCYLNNLYHTYCGFEKIKTKETEYTFINYSFSKLLIIHNKSEGNILIGGQIEKKNEKTEEMQIAIVLADKTGVSQELLIVNKNIDHLAFANHSNFIDLVSYIYYDNPTNDTRTIKLRKEYIFYCKDIVIGSNIPISFSISNKYLDGIEAALYFDSFSTDNIIKIGDTYAVIDQAYKTTDLISTTEQIEEFSAQYHLGNNKAQCTIKIHSCFENCDTCNDKGITKDNKCYSCANGYYPSIKKGNCELLNNNNFVNGENIIQTCPINCATCGEQDGIVKCLSCKEPNIYLTEDGNCLEKCPNESTSDNKCNKKCPKDQVFQDGICSQCKETNKIYYEEACYQKCPLNTFNYKNKCYKKCPLGTFSSLLERACHSCPEKQVYFQDYCLSSCPEGYSASDTELLICKKCRDLEPYYYQGKCYSVCPNKPDTFSFICDECNGFNQDDYNCIDICPYDFNKFNQCTTKDPLPEIDPEYPIAFNHNPISNNNREIAYFKDLSKEQQSIQIKELYEKISLAVDVYTNYDYVISRLSDLVLFYQIVSIGNIQANELIQMIEEINIKALDILSSPDIKAICFYLGDEMQILSLILYYSSLNNKVNASESFETLYKLSLTYLNNYIKDINNLDQDQANHKVYDDYLSDVLFGTTQSISKQIEVLRDVQNKDFNPEEAVSPKYQITYALIVKESYLNYKQLIENLSETMIQFKATSALKTINFELVNRHLNVSSSSDGIVQSNCDLSDYNKLLDKMKEQGLNKLVCLPNNLISQYPTLESGHVGVIDYRLYPLLNKNITALSNEFFSIRLFTKNNEYVPLNNLSEPILIIMHKPNSSYNECIFYNEELKTPNNTDCVSVNIEPYLICSCTHLTDFSLSIFNPVNIFNDIIKLFEQARFITSWEAFKYLNASNATVLYLFSSILLLFLIGLFFTIRADMKGEEDCFVIIVDKDRSCCSKEEIEEEIDELADKTIEMIKIRKKIVEKHFHGEGKNTQEKNKALLSKFNIVLKEPTQSTDDPVIEMKQDQQNIREDDTSIDTIDKVEEEIIQSNCLIENQSQSDDINKNNVKNEQIDSQNEPLLQNEQIDYQNEPLLQNELNKEYVDTTETNTDKDIMSNSNANTKKKENKLMTLMNMNKLSIPSNNSEIIEKNEIYQKSDGDTLLTTTTKDQKLEMSLLSKEENKKEPLNNHWFLSLFYVLKEFFLNEYRVCVLVYNKEHLYTRTDILILTAIRLIACISICALFSKCVPMGEDVDEIEKGFTNRNLAVSISTIFIIEIPFTLFEILLLKPKVSQKKADTK